MIAKYNDDPLMLLYLHLKGKELNNENNKTKGKSTII